MHEHPVLWLACRLVLTLPAQIHHHEKRLQLKGTFQVGMLFNLGHDCRGPTSCEHTIAHWSMLDAALSYSGAAFLRRSVQHFRGAEGGESIGPVEVPDI